MRTLILAIPLILIAGCEQPPAAPPAMKLECKAEWALATTGFDICSKGDPDGMCERLTFSIPVDQLDLSGVNYTCKIQTGSDLTLKCVINRETGEFSASVFNSGNDQVVSGNGTCTEKPLTYQF